MLLCFENEYLDGGERMHCCSLTSGESECCICAVQYSRLPSVLSQGGMSSVSSGVTEAPKYEASR